MTTPNPAQLAEALLDLARGYGAEIPGLGTPNPQLGARLTAHAKRIPTRIKPDDPRLSSFAGHTDATGYLWAPEPLHQYLADPANQMWSFERWFTGLAESCSATPALSGGELDELADEAAQYETFARAGLRPVEINHAGGNSAVMFTRPKP